ncbi:MAG: DinB family protein [Gemmatimonadota bacterium]|nr:DinB family protein [Gemmatimonadota bacterium]MDH3479947.1 DinB family protein [Gemmatimonadota bacterium]MDH3570804.1 DinB family protein [Gemmatimonadota bacterium]MDH5551095.1 DinB family protein [Gemmatimonadota bacterium]
MQKRLLIPTLLVLAALPVTAMAQEEMQHDKMEHAEMTHEHGVGMASIQPLYDQFKGWLIASADQMPQEHYGFKPSADVRSFGQVLGHVANASYMFCSAALGEAAPSMPNLEEVTAKAELVKGIKAAFAYCDKAYQIPEENAMESVTFFGREGSKLWVLNFNAMHDAEHYGNLVTYMRMKGMTPPSSQRGEM